MVSPVATLASSETVSTVSCIRSVNRSFPDESVNVNWPCSPRYWSSWADSASGTRTTVMAASSTGPSLRVATENVMSRPLTSIDAPAGTLVPLNVNVATVSV